MLLITAGELGSIEFEIVVLAFHPGSNMLPVYHLSIWLSALAMTWTMLRVTDPSTENYCSELFVVLTDPYSALYATELCIFSLFFLSWDLWKVKIQGLRWACICWHLEGGREHLLSVTIDESVSRLSLLLLYSQKPVSIWHQDSLRHKILSH